MATNNNIEEKIEHALHSMDQYERATPAPYLATRINAALLSAKNPNTWDKFYALIARPGIALAGMIVIVLLNILIITSNNNNDSGKIQAETNGEWGYSTVNTSALYDVENIEP